MQFSSFQSAKSLVPQLPPPRYSEDDEVLAYFNPVIRSTPPKLWIVRDPMGVSEQEAIDCSEIIETTDEFASFDEKGRVVWDMDRLDQIPIYKKRVDY